MTTALVTGASRGVGRGIVEGLAEAGMDVYFTGRDAGRLEATAERVGELGGRAFPRRLDHADDEAVRALFAEIERAQSLDLLVNNAWGGYANMVEAGRFTWADPYWDQPLWRWDTMLGTDLRAAFVASQLATRQMLSAGRGLIVNVSYWSARKHLGNLIYGVAKAATDKMTADMAVELSDSGVYVLSLYPGLVRTERVLEHAEHLDLSRSESPRFLGRVVAALWNAPDYVRERSGQVCVAAQCARDLDVTDVDGSSPGPLSLEDA